LLDQGTVLAFGPGVSSSGDGGRFLVPAPASLPRLAPRAAQGRQTLGRQRRPLIEGVPGIGPALKGVHIAAGPGLGRARRPGVQLGGIFAPDLRISALGQDGSRGAVDELPPCSVLASCHASGSARQAARPSPFWSVAPATVGYHRPVRYGRPSAQCPRNG